MIDGRGATSIGEVLEANPPVQRIGALFALFDAINIRRFTIAGPGVALDGSFGLANARRGSIASVERIELLKGPSALLNGVPPNGGIGGTVNLIPKRPTDDPLTRVSLDFISDGNIGSTIDDSRRFGENDALGVRFNGQFRDGPLPQNNAAARDIVAALALDYETGPLTLSALVDYQNLQSDAPPFVGFQLAPGISVPDAPDNRTNAALPTTFMDKEIIIGQIKAIYQFSADWSVTAAFRTRNQTEENLQSDWTITASAEYGTPVKGLTLTGQYLYNSSREIELPNNRTIPG